MGVRDLFFSITARDETAQAFGSVKRSLRDIDGMAATSGERLSRLGGRMVRAGALMTAATAPIALAFRDALPLYDQQVSAEAKVRQAVEQTGAAAGLTADELFRQASALQAITTFGDESILNDVTAQLLTFGNIAGEQFLRAQTAALDVATVLDGDLKSASIALGKALDDPIAGITALSRMGITFSKSQKEVVRALVEAGEVAQAQDLILDEIMSKYGGQAEAAALVGTGPMQQALNMWGDLKEDVGRVLVEIIPPIASGIETVVDGFLSLPEPIRNASVAIGGLTLVLGPLTIAIGGLVALLGTVSGPALLVAGGIAAITAAVVAFWPEVDTASAATDTLTLALGDEITQSQLLQTALAGNTQMSASAAKQKLAEAMARHENVKAIIAEHRAMALESTSYQGLLGQIEDVQNALNATGFPAIDAVVPFKADAYNQLEEMLVDLRNQQMAMLEAPEALQEQIQLTGENIATLEAALESANGAVVTFGEGLVEPIEPGERLGDALDRVGAGAGTAANGLATLEPELDAVAALLAEMEPLADGVTDSILSGVKGMITDWDFSWRSFADIALSAMDNVLDYALGQFADPMSNVLASLFNGLFGGGFGGLFGSTSGAALAVPGFATGGEMTVAGRAGMDRNLATIAVSRGETVQVKRHGEGGGNSYHFTFSGVTDAASFQASRGQIARQMAAAVARGQRNA